MRLTDIERRFIVSPSSFLPKIKKSVKYKTRVKIVQILSDVEFLQCNANNIYSEFGIKLGKTPTQKEMSTSGTRKDLADLL